MLNLTNDQCEFYSTKVSFYDNGELKTEYTDNPSLYSKMVNDYNHLSNFTSEAVNPTDEQTKRLKQIKKLIKSDTNLQAFGSKIIAYVETGYIDSSCPDWMQSLVSKNETKSKEILLEKLNSRVSKMKTEKEYGGCDYQGHILASDTESQSKISSTLLGFMSGMISEVNFKFKDGFVNMNQEQLTAVSTFLMSHVQSCFTAESLTKEQIAKLNLDELLEYDVDSSTSVMSSNEEKTDKLQELYNSKYTEVMNAFLTQATQSTSETKKK